MKLLPGLTDKMPMTCSCVNCAKGYLHHEGLPGSATTVQDPKEGCVLRMDAGEASAQHRMNSFQQKITLTIC